MVEEVVGHLGPERGGFYLDGTVGGGGHAAALVAAGPEARLVGLDLDPEAIEAARRRLGEYADSIELVRASFQNVLELRQARGWPAFAGVVLDLGVSSRQLDETARGFSFRPGTALDMRMGGTPGGRRPAATLLNQATEEELGRIFREYGEERRWPALAREIVRRRRDRPFVRSDDLVEVIHATLGPQSTFQDKARLFQALRIAVNDELGALEHGLEEIREALAPGGRLAVIAYHSLEDRIVKHAFREWSRACICPPGLPVCRCRGAPLGRTVTRKPLRPSAVEVARNPRARSAHLRVWEKG